jgi:hypothetical protein
VSNDDFLNSVPTFVPELSYDANGASSTETEEDPDGAGRGGYHQVTESVTVKDGVVHHEYSVSDYYKERLGEAPEPWVENQEDAVSWLENHLANHQAACEALRKLVELARAATGYVES